MRDWAKGGRFLAFGAVLAMTFPLLAGTALAKTRHVASSHIASGHIAAGQTASVHKVARGGRTLVAWHGHAKHLKGAKARYAYGGLQCVPFARAASGIELKGNAANWWDAAEGVYERGSRPEPGSVLNFRSTGHMRLGHVAVVTAVRSSREIEIEHANWAGPGANKGGISRDIPVVDVSAENDWSAVRVGLGRSGDYGSTYPTYGFIYDRADRGVMVANAAPSGRVSRAVFSLDELAEAKPRRGRAAPLLDLSLDGPSRGLR